MLLIMKNKKRKRDPKYKQLSFETAIRNPERYKGILEYMQDYQGIVLNDENLLTIVSGMYENGIVTSPDFDLSKYSTKEEIYNSVISINSTRKADGGFPKATSQDFGHICELYRNLDLFMQDIISLLKLEMLD